MFGRKALLKEEKAQTDHLFEIVVKSRDDAQARCEAAEAKLAALQVAARDYFEWHACVQRSHYPCKYEKALRGLLEGK